MFAVIVKHPLSEVVAYVDWSGYLTTLQTTAQSSVWENPLAAPIVLTGPLYSQNVASIEIGGGVPDRVHIVENRLECADGSRNVFRLSVYVK